MTMNPRRRDPLETALEVALQPGRFIAYRSGWDFVSSLEEVADHGLGSSCGPLVQRKG
jgi:hypothetical protein